MIPLRGQKNLGFMFQPAKCLAVNDPVPVSLIGSPDITSLLFPLSSFAVLTESGIRT